MRIFLLLSCFLLTSCKTAVVNQSESLIDGLTAGSSEGYWPRMGPLAKWCIDINTFSHKVPSEDIRDLYYRACKKLYSLYGNQVETYRWEDKMGYPGQITIVQFKSEGYGDSSYLMAGVFEANDNDSFWFSYNNGTCDVSSMVKQKDWALDDILRCNHGNTKQVAPSKPPKVAR